MYRKLAMNGPRPSLLIPQGRVRQMRRRTASRRTYWMGLLELFARLRWRCP